MLGILGVAMAVVLAACSTIPGDDTPTTAPPSPVLPTPEVPTATPTLTPKPPPTPSVKGDVVVWLDWTPEELRGLSRVVDQFLTEYPGIVLHLVYVPTEQFRESLELGVIEGSGPTLAILSPELGRELWDAGLVLDIRDKVSPELFERIQALAWTQVTYDDAIVGIPLEMQGILLYRNTSLAPEQPSTVEELVSTAEGLREAGRGVGAAFDMGFRFSVSHLATCGATIEDEDGGIGFEGEGGICWLELLYQLSLAGPVSFGGPEPVQQFQDGQAAWAMATTEYIRGFARQMGEENLAIDTWPVYSPAQSRMAGYVWAESIHFLTSANPADMEAAEAFVSYLTTPLAQLILADPTGAAHLPSVADIEPESPLQRKALEVLGAGIPLPLGTQIDSSKRYLERAVRLVVEQGATPDYALLLTVVDSRRILPTHTPTPEG